MTDIVHSVTRDGYTIDIVHDYDNIDPRDGDCYGIFVTFDEMQNGSDDTIEEQGEYPTADGTGYFTPTNVSEWGEVLAILYPGLRYMRPVLYESHGPQSRYMLDVPNMQWYAPDGLDGRTIGFLLYTADHIKAWWGDEPPDDTMLMSMQAEIDEFTDWANGNTWGYRITDINGDEVEAVWGYICDWDVVLQMALDEAACLPPVEPLHTLRITIEQLALLANAVSNATIDWDRKRDLLDIIHATITKEEK
jgi:hypothetical protein